MSWQAFNAKIANSSELQAQARAIVSPMELLAFAQAQGIELTGADLSAIAQNAYQQWITTLDGNVRQFFETVHTNPELNESLKQCQTPEDAIALGQRCGVKLTVTDLQQAALQADAIIGFSFERLWFRNLGLIQA
jgi:predicted ribosomally synthesized peptide with nif11-like leader